MIHFGARSIWLTIGVAHGLVLALLLLRAPVNRTANRLLALLVALVAVRVLPYIIGYAGVYDRWPWLSFLPHDWSLAYGALVWLYVVVLCTGALPRRWWWHLLPGALQGAYYCAVFPRTLAFKDAWNDAVHVPYVVPIETVGSLATLALYLGFAWHAQRRYQRWLDQELSNREEFRLVWVRGLLAAMAATLLVALSFAVIDAMVTALDYFDRFPLYLWFSALVYGLGLGGLRHARLAYPRPGTITEADAPAAPDTVRPVEEAPPDWGTMGRQWEDELRTRGWWRDPDLTAPRLARLLGTNGTYLSRAFNEGLGRNFNEVVNRLRVEAVQDELRRPGPGRDLLPIALDAGFNSKASFNRVFKRLVGVTPSAFRAAAAADTTTATSQNP